MNNIDVSVLYLLVHCSISYWKNVTFFTSEFLASHPSQLLKSWYIFFFQLPYFAEWLIGLNDYESFEMLNKNEGGIQNKANRLNPDEIELYKHAVGRSIGTAINYYRASKATYTLLLSVYRLQFDLYNILPHAGYGPGAGPSRS